MGCPAGSWPRARAWRGVGSGPRGAPMRGPTVRVTPTMAYPEVHTQRVEGGLDFFSVRAWGCLRNLQEIRWAETILVKQGIQAREPSQVLRVPASR